VFHVTFLLAENIIRSARHGGWRFGSTVMVLPGRLVPTIYVFKFVAATIQLP
jgi:hypothetical protein